LIWVSLVYFLVFHAKPWRISHSLAKEKYLTFRIQTLCSFCYPFWHMTIHSWWWPLLFDQTVIYRLLA
jgi:hypothetical protein